VDRGSWSEKRTREEKRRDDTRIEEQKQIRI
jgi:hypothetical protein